MCPPDPAADLALAWRAAMDRGDDAAAWAVSDRVLAGRDPARRDDPRLPYHRRWIWDGRRFDGRHVLVRCYHGLGDTLQYARFLPALRSRVASLTLEVQPALLALLAGLLGPDRVLPFAEAAPAPASECDLEIMELSHALRLRPDQVPPASLGVTARASPKGSVGLCWRAGEWDPSRSAPADLVAALACGRPAVSLVPGPAPAALAVLNPGGCPVDIADTAALIAGLDRVITVDTMVAHLAGTLNRPTWLLLPHAADWRWMQHGGTSRWYPSMHLRRQPAAGDWHAMIASAMGVRRQSP